MSDSCDPTGCSPPRSSVRGISRAGVLLVARSVESAGSAGDQVQSLGREDPLEKGMAMHSSILAWRIPRTEEPGRLQSMGLQESDMTEQLSIHQK